jgi:hypothetical protein
VCWTVGSKLECLALVALLDEHPLRSRKRAEYEIWREGVQVWAANAYGVGSAGRARLTKLAGQLRSARVYREPAHDPAFPNLTDSHARDHFAGFFSGEGCFGLGARSARFTIKLRRDDRPLLEAFRREFGVGTICDVDTPAPWAPAAVWHATSAPDVLRGIELFDAVSLLGRKARQYRAWRPGALAVARGIISRSDVDAATVHRSRQAMRDASAYRPPSSPLELDDGGASARNAYRQVLQRWAASTEGLLACTAYASARRELHPHWPKRETLTAEFGSWFDALRSAGLAHRAARRPSVRQLRVQFDRFHGGQGLRYRAAFLRRLGGLLEV